MVNPVELAGGIGTLPLVREALTARYRPADVLRSVALRDSVWQPVYDATNAGNDAALGQALHRVLTRHPTGMTATPWDLQRLWNGIPKALDGTDPRFVVNRKFTSVMKHLEDRRPIMTDTAGGSHDDAWLAKRLDQETRLGYHGEGSDAGRSVYVSLQFGDTVGGVPYTTNLAPVTPNGGAWNFGAYSMEIGRHVAPRTTIARADSPLLRGADELGGVEQLRSVTMERLARDTQLTNALEQVDDATHAQVLRAYIRSNAFSRLDVADDAFFEGQVRGGMDIYNDVRRISVDRHQYLPDSATVERVERVRDAARKLDIPVSFDSRPWDANIVRNPHPDEWWKNIGGAPRPPVLGPVKPPDPREGVFDPW